MNEDNKNAESERTIDTPKTIPPEAPAKVEWVERGDSRLDAPEID